MLKRARTSKILFSEKKENLIEEVRNIAMEKSKVEQVVNNFNERLKELKRFIEEGERKLKENEIKSNNLEITIKEQERDIGEKNRSIEDKCKEINDVMETRDLLLEELEKIRAAKQVEAFEFNFFITASKQSKFNISKDIEKALKRKKTLEDDIYDLETKQNAINEDIRAKTEQERTLKDSLYANNKDYDRVFNENIKLMKQNKILNK